MIYLPILILVIIYIIVLIKNKKAVNALPYLLMTIITPIYNFLDEKIFVKIFGCGCVPISQTNMFNIDFNANDLRRVVYIVMALLITILAIYMSRKFEKKSTRIIYISTVLILNIILALIICNMFIWM